MQTETDSAYLDMRFITLILSSILYLFLNNGFANEIIEPTIEVQHIGNKSKFYVDPERKLTIQDAWTLNNKGEFTSNKTNFFSRPSSNSNYWFTFSIKTDLEDIWLNINNNSLDSVHFFLLNDEGTILKEVLTGSILPKSSREFKADTYWFEITNNQDTSIKHIFIKTYAGMSMEIPLELGSFDLLLENKISNDFYAHFFIGAMVVMLLYNLFIFFIVRDKLYFYYVIYILGAIFASTMINNYPIIENVIGQYYAHCRVPAWIWVAFVGAILFTIEYLEIKTSHKYIYYVLNGFILTYFAFAFIEIVIPQIDVANAYQMLIPTSLITCLLTAYYMAFKRNKKAILYSLGWTILIISALLYLLATNGFLPFNSFTRNFTYMGIIAEVIIFSIALAQRINILKKDQEVLNLKLTNTNNELVLNNESLDSFNYHVSHDLKTVLNNATVLSRMIKKYNDKKDYEKINEVVDKLQIVTLNGSETVQSFLSLGKIDSLISSEIKEDIIIEKQIEQLLQNHNLNESINISIINPLGTTLCMHEKAFESIFLNLITNAIKYSNSEPNVLINVTTENKLVIIKFKDNGIGMDLTKNGKKVFEPFVRILNKKNVEGSGIGLFLVKKLITSMHGEITVESELGSGTTFIISLPIQN